MRLVISRQRVLLRAQYGWPQATVPYNKSAVHEPDGYRTDAAGFVSMCWGIPLTAPHSYGGMSTMTLETDGWVSEIQPVELLPGDALGLCGPGSVDMDGGVIVIFEGWLNNDPNTGYALTWEQLPDSSPGPIRRARVHSFRWHAYRFRDIED